MKACKWCGKGHEMPGRLCPGCRVKADNGGKPPKRDAMNRRLPGHYGAREGG